MAMDFYKQPISHLAAFKYPGTENSIVKIMDQLREIADSISGLYIQQAIDDARNDLDILEKVFRSNEIAERRVLLRSAQAAG